MVSRHGRLRQVCGGTATRDKQALGTRLRVGVSAQTTANLVIELDVDLKCPKEPKYNEVRGS